MDKMKLVETQFMKKKTPEFNIGDVIRVYMNIHEEGKSRTQAFEGVVIARKGCGIRETLTVRRISYGEGVERVFQMHSPLLEKIEVVKSGRVRRAKLYYLRRKIGKGAKVEEEKLAKPLDSTPEDKTSSAGETVTT